MIWREINSQGDPMNKILSAVTAAIALAASSALAADIPVYEPAPAAPVAAPVVTTWTGFYAGLHAGYGWGDRHFDYDEDSFLSDCCDISAEGFDYDPNGLVAGGQIGFNYQWNYVVLGIEGDASWSHMDDELHIEDYFRSDLDVDVSIDWLASIRGRLGLAFDRFMAYGTGGVAWAGVETDVDHGGNSSSDGQTHHGWVAGLGVEAMVTDMVTVRAEYLHYEFGEEDYDYTDELGSASYGQADLDADVVRVGVNVLFNGLFN